MPAQPFQTSLLARYVYSCRCGSKAYRHLVVEQKSSLSQHPLLMRLLLLLRPLRLAGRLQSGEACCYIFTIYSKHLQCLRNARN